MKHPVPGWIRACALALLGVGSLALGWPVQGDTPLPQRRDPGVSAEFLDAAAFAHARDGSGPSGIEALFVDVDFSGGWFDGF